MSQYKKDLIKEMKSFNIEINKKGIMSKAHILLILNTIDSINDLNTLYIIGHSFFEQLVFLKIDSRDYLKVLQSRYNIKK